MFHRRALARYGALACAALFGLVLGVPGAAYVLTPLLRRRKDPAGFVPLARFHDLKVGVPQALPVIETRQDAWVRYPPEPVGLVWLIRQPEGSAPPVLAFSAECPHLACAINLSADGRGFFCPCHTSSFNLKGERLNKVPPRGMDPLEVEDFRPDDPHAEVRVRFQRFQTMTERRVPLG